jgi:hypothetical protein
VWIDEEGKRNSLSFPFAEMSDVKGMEEKERVKEKNVT